MLYQVVVESSIISNCDMSKVFRYRSGDVVMVGDHVREHGCPAIVEMVIRPNTSLAEYFMCPNGGVMLFYGDGGRLLMDPPDGMQWEDLEFVARASEGPYETNLVPVCAVLEVHLLELVISSLRKHGIRVEGVEGNRKAFVLVSETDAQKSRSLLRALAVEMHGIVVIEGGEVPL